MNEPRPDAVQTFFGGLLMVVGALMAALCGLCTAAFLVMGAASPGGEGVAVLAIPIGGIPTALGVGIYMAGRRVRGAAKRPKVNPQTFE